MTGDVLKNLHTDEHEYEQDFESLWMELQVLYEKLENGKTADYIFEVLGDNCTLPIDTASLKINHFAFYIGDYIYQESIFQLANSFDAKFKQNELSFFDYGPSHLAAKYYGTQGWWFSINCNDGKKIELFTFMQFGEWKVYTDNKKVGLMSHVAVEVQEKETLLKLMDFYSGHPFIKVITYVDGDELGHTYIHLLNKSSNRLIEFITK